MAQAQALADPAESVAPASESRNRPVIWQAGTGFSFSSGDYGRPVSTEVIAVPLNLRVRQGAWSLRLATSYLSITGPASVVDTDDGEGGADGGADAGLPNQTRSGFGDVSATIAHRFDLTRTTALSGEVRVKFPTASQSQRLTTGTTDVTLRARLSQDLGDVSLRAGVQRRFAGGGGRVELRDSWGASAGASLDLGDNVVTGVDVSWQQSSYASGNANTSATAFVSAPLSRRVRLTGYGATGFSRNSPDYTFGASISLRLD